MQATKLDTRNLPTVPALAELLPGGALQQGAAYSVVGSTSLVMALLAAASAGREPGAASSACPTSASRPRPASASNWSGSCSCPRPASTGSPLTAALVDVLAVVVIRPPLRVGDAAAPGWPPASGSAAAP